LRTTGFVDRVHLAKLFTCSPDRQRLSMSGSSREAIQCFLGGSVAVGL
jgi:hypothetical protein